MIHHRQQYAPHPGHGTQLDEIEIDDDDLPVPDWHPDVPVPPREPHLAEEE